jgi:hypothetical protein
VAVVSAIPQDPTLQEVFDHVARHLLKQGKVCRVSHSPALHWGPLSCAVGCLIDNASFSAAEAKTFTFNFASERDPLVVEAVCASLGVDYLNPETVDLLRLLRTIHDDGQPQRWMNRLRRLANHWDFDTSALCDAKAVR